MEDKILCNVSDLEPIADAVREKENTNKLYSVEELKVKVPELIGSGSGIELPVLTNPATASDALSGKEFIDGDGNKVTGTIATKASSNLTASGATVTVPAGYYASQATKSVATATQATPSVNIDANGKITASATQTAGYVVGGTKTGTKQLTTQGAQTITPSTTDKTINSGTYLTGTQTIKGDANLVASNIAQGVSIFGITGSHSGGTDTSDATATVDDIVIGETAYVNGIKLTGTNPYEKTTTDAQVAEIEGLIEELNAALDGKSVPGDGGGSIETCEITYIDPSEVNIFCYTTVENGQVVVKETSVSNRDPITIHPIKQSLIVFYFNTSSPNFYTEDDCITSYELFGLANNRHNLCIMYCMVNSSGTIYGS